MTQKQQIAKICKLCPKELSNQNKSGYCMKCYRKSPPYLKYQREYQRKLYLTPKRKAQIALYNQRPDVKKRMNKYNMKWKAAHPERYKEIQRAWRKAHPGYGK